MDPATGIGAALLLFAATARAGFDQAPPDAVSALFVDVPSDPVLVFDPPIAEAQQIRLPLRRGGAIIAELDLVDPKMSAMDTRVRTPSFGLTASIFVPDVDESVLRRLVRAAQAVEANDVGAFRSYEAQFAGMRPAWGLMWQLTAVAVGVAVIAAVIQRQTLAITASIKLTHALPSSIQTSLLLYWALYCPLVVDRAPQIVGQLVLAYSVDAAVRIVRTGKWELNLGPLPIVLSMNLVTWFSSAFGASLAVVCGIVSRVALTRSDGKHIFNPSVFGLAVVGLLALAGVPDLPYGGLFHLMNLAPSMAELVLILSFVPLWRLPLVLVSIGAVLGLMARNSTGGLWEPQAVLAFALLYTEPATIPKTGLGRLMFGFFIGVGFAECSFALRRAGQPDDFAKFLPVPIANLLVPQFDAVATAITSRLPTRLDDVFEPRWNKAHLLIWLWLIVPRIVSMKAESFDSALHWTLGTPGIVYGADDVPSCGENPAWCRAFDVVDEVRAWLAPSSEPAP
jgi:hypothetical protein